MYELLNKKPPASAPAKARKETILTEVKAPWGTYKLTLHRSLLGKYMYTDYAVTTRESK